MRGKVEAVNSETQQAARAAKVLSYYFSLNEPLRETYMSIKEFEELALDITLFIVKEKQARIINQKLKATTS